MGIRQTCEEDGLTDMSIEFEYPKWAETVSCQWYLRRCGSIANSYQISAFTAMDDLSQLAVGFGNGAVTVIRGDLIHDRGAKQRTVHESEEPITGLSFREEERLVNLYVATTSRLVKLVISGRAHNQSARPVEDSGCGVGCMTVDKKNSDILVVRDDAIYYYRVDGRNSCYGYDGTKSLVAVYGDYVAIVSPPRYIKCDEIQCHSAIWWGSCR